MVLSILACYLVLQLFIGYKVSRRIHSENDYLIAGRSLGPWLTTFGIFATWFGAETCLGAAGRIYKDGLTGGSADPFGYAICILLVGCVIAIPLWKLKLTTLGDLFRLRYSKGVEKLAVTLMIPTSLLWSAAQIRGFGVILTSISGMDLTLMITIAALIVLLYTTMGGLLADSITDLIQGIMLALGLLILFVLSWREFGFDVIGRVSPEKLQLFDLDSHGLLGTLEAWSVPVIGSLVAAELLTKVMAAKSPDVARSSAIKAFCIYLAIGMIPVYIGLIGAELIPDLEVPEQIIPFIAQNLMPTFVYAIFMGALLSAILSTVDSSLLAAASLFSHNIMIPLYKNELSEKRKLLFSRGAVVVFGLIAYVMALYAEGVYSLVEEASAFGSAGIVVCILFALLTKWNNATSAILCLLSGLISYVVFNYILSHPYPFLMSLMFSIIGYILPYLNRSKNFG